MRITTQTTAEAFMSLFPKPESFERQRSFYAVESNAEVIFRHLNFAGKLFPQNTLMLCPLSHRNTNAQYITENCSSIFGYTSEELLKMSLVEFLSLIHPEDLTHVQQCLHFITGFVPFDPETHRFCMQFRIRHKNGTYRCIREEKIAIKTENESYLYVMLMSVVPEEEKFYHVKLEVLKSVHGNFVKVYTYNPRQEQSEITPRQHDIARLITKGFTNQEIADQLSVSVFTVKNHKQSLFKKMNVKSSLELANYVKQLS